MVYFFQAYSTCSFFPQLKNSFSIVSMLQKQLYALVGQFFCTYYDRYFLMSLKSLPERHVYWRCFLVYHFPVLRLWDRFWFAVIMCRAQDFFLQKPQLRSLRSIPLQRSKRAADSSGSNFSYFKKSFQYKGQFWSPQRDFNNQHLERQWIQLHTLVLQGRVIVLTFHLALSPNSNLKPGLGVPKGNFSKGSRP